MGNAINHWKNYTIKLIEYLVTQGKTKEEIGAILGISKDAIRMLLTRSQDRN